MTPHNGPIPRYVLNSNSRDTDHEQPRQDPAADHHPVHRGRLAYRPLQPAARLPGGIWRTARAGRCSTSPRATAMRRAGRISVLSTIDRSDFDELWLFAVDVGDGLTPEDCAAISRFRRARRRADGHPRSYGSGLFGLQPGRGRRGASFPHARIPSADPARRRSTIPIRATSSGPTITPAPMAIIRDRDAGRAAASGAERSRRARRHPALSAGPSP